MKRKCRLPLGVAGPNPPPHRLTALRDELAGDVE